MLTKAIKFQMVALILIVSVQTGFVDAQVEYPETINALQTVYRDEIRAHLTYLAYAREAISENYPNIAHLFVSLAASESIHARNFKQLLIDLKVELKQSPKPEIKVSTTKENLKSAAQAELQDIDYKYPQSLERAGPEGHDATIRYMTYAWDSEKQHRELIKKIESGTGILFKMLSGIIERTPHRYFVCQECGSTIRELPEVTCHICKGSVSNYKEIERVK
jgi:rubrerythrin